MHLLSTACKAIAGGACGDGDWGEGGGKRKEMNRKRHMLGSPHRLAQRLSTEAFFVPESGENKGWWRMLFFYFAFVGEDARASPFLQHLKKICFSKMNQLLLFCFFLWARDILHRKQRQTGLKQRCLLSVLHICWGTLMQH